MAWLLLFLTSGLGWLAALAGYLTADLIVPEAVAFYTLYTNPHFPLALAGLLTLFLALLWPFEEAAVWDGRQALVAALASAVVALTQPFLFLTIGLVVALALAWRWARDRRFPLAGFGYAALAGGVAVALVTPQWLALTGNPTMRAHAAQDVTLSPPAWDYALSFAFLLPLAAWGAARAARRHSGADVLLLIWLGVNLLLPYAPLSLQRRLIMGLQVPLALLAADGLLDGLLARANAETARRATRFILAAASLTNLFLLALGTLAAARLDPKLYLLPGEPAAMRWLAAQPAAGAVVALPRTLMFVPAWSGQRAYAGHPMETLDAKRKQAEVEALFAGGSMAILDRDDVGWLWVGPYERERAALSFLQGLGRYQAAYHYAGVTIYRLGPAAGSGP